ncbi:hypothetical protein CAEBREN_12109 [Caenorhabditis brenneri]|uniref:C-type LECtin n=1 Tax=Caenorhabditis brenneri TaxID=135651 RepID=G0MU94_CAEBE|nr:hypothetical protein CAEBREN_12109 [Caenorhabditis brenneri]
MKCYQFFLLLLSVSVGSALYDPSSYTDRPCGNDISNLWLDVVAVVDNSIGMTTEHLNNIAANIGTLFADTRIGTRPSEPRTTRLGLVTYNSLATTNADLNKFQSLDDVYNGLFSALDRTSNTNTAYLATGLQAAGQLFATQSIGSLRNHYKRVIIVYTSKYQGSGELDPVPMAARFRADGIYIITVAYGDDSKALSDNLQKIATPGFNFTYTSQSLVRDIQGALLQSNCFCPNDWIHYRQSYLDMNSYRYGSCLKPVNLPGSWKQAQLSCHSRHSNSYLVTEFNSNKHDFILTAVKNTFDQPISYHIGLNYINGIWVWDQPTGLPPVPMNGSSWDNWIPGYPKNPHANSGVQNIQTGFGVDWQNIPVYIAMSNYICETYSCDSDNFCDASDVKH